MGLLTDQILNKVGKSNQTDPVSSFIRTYHVLMTTYGWIPFETYLELPQDLVNALLAEIIKDNPPQKKKGKLRGKK